jgi:type III pantothenate kinase
VKPHIVVDIGNSRMKWGRCLGRVEEVAALPLDDLNAWDDLAEKWDDEPGGGYWVVAGVNPKRIEQFLQWQRHRRGNCWHIANSKSLPLSVAVDQPEAVGIDRLLGAVAAKALVPPGTPAITIDVGTATTINWIDATGVFQGGAILPGPRLMALALNQNTAALPLVDSQGIPDRTGPGKNTQQAIQLGILSAQRGAAMLLVQQFAALATTPPWVFLTGGGAGWLANLQFPPAARFLHCPELNLEGIRLTAEASR